MEVNLIILVPAAIGVLIIASYLGWFFNSKIGQNNVVRAEEKSKQLIEDAEKEAKAIKREKLLEVKDEWLQKKQEFDNEVNTKKQKILGHEKKLESREESLEKRYELVSQKEKENKKLEGNLLAVKEQHERKSNELERLVVEQNVRLEKIAGLTTEEAKKMLMENVINIAKNDASQQIKDIRDKAKV